MQPLLSIRNITKRFARNLSPVVEDLSFEVHTGEIFALLGTERLRKNNHATPDRRI